MFKRLLSAPEQSRAAKTVEIYGWIIFLEGGLLLLFPDFMARLMHFGPLTAQAFWVFTFKRHAGFRLWDALFAEWTSQCGGLCICHIDRSAIRRTDHALWYFGALPGPLALLFAIEDSASWLWTLL